MALSVLRSLLLFHAVNVAADKNIVKTFQLQKIIDIQCAPLAKNILRKTLHEPRIALDSSAPQTNIRLNFTAFIRNELVALVLHNLLAKNNFSSVILQKLASVYARLLRITLKQTVIRMHYDQLLAICLCQKLASDFNTDQTSPNNQNFWGRDNLLTDLGGFHSVLQSENILLILKENRIIDA